MPWPRRTIPAMPTTDQSRLKRVYRTDPPCLEFILAAFSGTKYDGADCAFLPQNP